MFLLQQANKWMAHVMLVQMRMDKIIDLVDGCGPMYTHPLHINRMSSERLSKISLMFGGIGDGLYPHIFFQKRVFM